MNDIKRNTAKLLEETERDYEEKNKGHGESDTLKIDIESIENDAFKACKDENEGQNQTVIEMGNIDEGRVTDDGKRNISRGWPSVKPNVIWVQYQGNMFGSGRHIPEGGGAALNYEPRTRNHFVKLVFVLVFIMLCCTAAFNIMVFNSPDMKEQFRVHGFLYALGAMVIMIGLNYAIACSPCTRQPPCNLVCLLLAVVGMSVICAFITVRYDTRIVFYAVVATASVVFVCILLACSNFDFTQWLLYVIVIGVAFSVIAMIAALSMTLTGTYFTTAHLIILLVGTLLNVVMIIIELQTILGGKAVELSEDDYALGAFLLYTSIVDVFLKMVVMMGIFDDW